MNKIWKNNKLNLSKIEFNKLKKLSSLNKELKLLFQFIKKREWIKYDRMQGKSDGLLGNIFEDLIGFKKNNNKKLDYNEIEIKTKKHSSKSFVSLFNLTINSFKNVNIDIREKYDVMEKHMVRKSLIQL